ncbi:MAG: site-specific integrase, partial [Betaproteobacteria bacterium]|nr:site-specific integrase [Betaproteobacteria bacterium]
MAREIGLYRRRDSRFWWVDVVLPNGRRICGSTKAESKKDAEAYVAALKRQAYEQGALGIRAPRTWREAVVRYLSAKANLRSIEEVRRLCRKLDPYFGELTLDQITGDTIWTLVQSERKKGNKPATVNRYLALIRCLLRMARDEWQWIVAFPKIRLLGGEVARDRWLTREEASQLISACPPHLAAMVRFALATGCRSREISGLEWSRVDLKRRTAWLDRTKNGTPRGVPLNDAAVAVLEEQRGKHPRYCFTYDGEPIRWQLSNSAWRTA